MMIYILRSLGDVGLIVGLGPVVSGGIIEVSINGENNGRLDIGAKSHKVLNGYVEIPEEEISYGKNLVGFATKKEYYRCGYINKDCNGIKIYNMIENTILAMLEMMVSQSEDIEKIKRKVWDEL